DEMRADRLASAFVDPEAVRAAKIVRSLEAEFDPPRRIGFRFCDGKRDILPALSGHAVADHASPIQLVGFTRLEAARAYLDRFAHTREMRSRYELARRRKPAHDLLCLQLRRCGQNSCAGGHLE